MEIVERFKHQAKRFVHQVVSAAGDFFSEHIHGKNRHRAADHDHILPEGLNLRREELSLKIQLVHHIAHNAGEQLVPNDGEKFVVGCPGLYRAHWPRASLILSTNCRAICVMDEKSPVLAPVVRLPANPTATAPALIQAPTFSRLTPP